MSQPDIVIALDEDHDPGNEVGPCYDGPWDQPIWALMLVTAPLEEDWGLQTVAGGLAYEAALQLARELGYESIPIGPASWPDDQPGVITYPCRVLDVAAAAGAAGTVAFVTAFATQLAKRFEGTVADWISKIHIRSKPPDPEKIDLEVELGGAPTVVEIDGDLPDEARLALIDLDTKDDTVRGHRLKWDGQAGAWVSAGKLVP